MNYMEQVTNMLGVELGEEFKLKDIENNNIFVYSFKFTEEGLMRIIENISNFDDSYREILSGEFEIIKLPQPILTDKEKEYLSNVIIPFSDIVECIAKHEYTDEYEYINIIYIDHAFGRCSIEFPCFGKGTMYKGMEVDKQYTLEELGWLDGSY